MLARARSLARFSTLLAILAYSTGCLDDDTTGPALELEAGSVKFDYFGSGFDGRFDAVGSFSRDTRGYVKPQSFAAAIDVDMPPYLYFGIIAAEFQTNSVNDLNVTISGQANGSYEVKSFENCSAMIEQGTGKCAAINYNLGLGSDGSFVTGTRRFELVGGTLTITSAADGRLRGNFTGTARQLASSSSAVSNPYVDDVEVEILNGSFDVPIVTLSQWNGF